MCFLSHYYSLGLGFVIAVVFIALQLCLLKVANRQPGVEAAEGIGLLFVSTYLFLICYQFIHSPIPSIRLF